MASKASAGSSKNGRDSGPKYLGIKINHGAVAKVGQVLVRQRGTVIIPGKNVDIGKDHTIFAMTDGKVEIKNKRKSNFDGSSTVRKIINVI